MATTINASAEGQSRNIVTRASVSAVNLNSANTDVATLTGLPAKYYVTAMRVYDASTSLAISVATLGLYTGSGGGGTALVAPATLTALTAASKMVSSILAVTTDYQTAGTLYLRNVLAHGGAATVSVVVEILDLTV